MLKYVGKFFLITMIELWIIIAFMYLTLINPILLMNKFSDVSSYFAFRCQIYKYITKTDNYE